MTTRPDAPPMRVGDYTLLTRLGEGGMGIVHLARGRDGKRVALKVLRPHIIGDREARTRLEREVATLSRIRSPWVAEILDADPWAEIPYVVTRYVPGLSLHDEVAEEGPIEDPDLLWFAGCLAEGVSAVHQAGVLHRDVKPSNVLMEGRTPILIDFGLARVAEDSRLTHTGWLLGTPGYLAPEILYGEDPTPAMDVHAWGATVAYAATGRPPYGRGPSMAIMDRTRRGQHDLTGMTGQLADVVDAALAPDPLARPLIAEILAWLRPLTTQPGPPTQPPAAGADRQPDVYTLPLALANGQPAPDAAATVVEGAASTLVEGGPATAGPAHPPARTKMLTELVGADVGADVDTRDGAGNPLPPPPRPGLPAMAQWEQAWDERQAAAPRAPFAERFRRGTVVGLGSLVVGAATALAPYLSLLLVIVAVWLLRTGSLAASASAQLQGLRGPRWYDGPRVALTTPWHSLRAVTGTVVLVLWSGGIALAVALLGYAFQIGTVATLLACGTSLGVSLWTGPGGGRVRSPLRRLVFPLARRPVPWLIGCAVLLALAGVLALIAFGQGVNWAPAGDGPFDL